MSRSACEDRTGRSRNCYRCTLVALHFLSATGSIVLTLTLCLRVFGANTPMLETQAQAHLVESFRLWCHNYYWAIIL